MIVMTNILGCRPAPRRPAGSTLWASIDVEWTKNYRIKNGNVPFCLSVVYVAVPDAGAVIDPSGLPFAYTSLYVENADETPALITAADEAVRVAVRVADRITGHQLSSDLSVLTNASTAPLTAVTAAREAWQERKGYTLADRRILDTRYDAGHILTGHSRRLVDVCTDLGLDVTQPELLRTSMTALHRAYLATGSTEARERISVLNIRHSLSTALVALRATGQASWSGTLNVNRLLAAELDDSIGWLAHPTFTALLGEPCLSATVS